MTTNPTPIPEPTSPTAVVVGKLNGKAAVAMDVAEVARLRALTTVDDAMVERAMTESWRVTGCCMDCLPDHLANLDERKAMRAALRAALGVES